jgi:predicted component of type VI protein secretion system
VFAQDVVASDAKFASTHTRAEVKAELAQARANGTLDVKDSEYPLVRNSSTSKTRAESIAEVARARADGTLEVNDATYPKLPATAAVKTHAEVRAELEQYQMTHPNGEDLYRGS